MADTPPNPHVSAPADEQSYGAQDPRHNPRGDGRQSNGEASAGYPETGQAETEEWEELDGDEQDDPATDYYALLNVPRDVYLAPSPSPPQSRAKLIETDRLRLPKSAVPTILSRSASIRTSSRPIAGNARRPTSTIY